MEAGIGASACFFSSSSSMRQSPIDRPKQEKENEPPRGDCGSGPDGGAVLKPKHMLSRARWKDAIGLRSAYLEYQSVSRTRTRTHRTTMDRESTKKP